MLEVREKSGGDAVHLSLVVEVEAVLTLPKNSDHSWNVERGTYGNEYSQAGCVSHSEKK